MTGPITLHHDIAPKTAARWPGASRATTVPLATSGAARAPPGTLTTSPTTEYDQPMTIFTEGEEPQ